MVEAIIIVGNILLVTMCCAAIGLAVQAWRHPDDKFGTNICPRNTTGVQAMWINSAKWQSLFRELVLIRGELATISRNQRTNQEATMATLDDLTAQVAANKTITASALALINGIAARITAAGTDPAALAALTASLKDDDDALAAAVTANTPAAPAST